jgi:hypothetical protein
MIGVMNQLCLQAPLAHCHLQCPQDELGPQMVRAGRIASARNSGEYGCTCFDVFAMDTSPGGLHPNSTCVHAFRSTPLLDPLGKLPIFLLILP